MKLASGRGGWVQALGLGLWAWIVIQSTTGAGETPTPTPRPLHEQIDRLIEQPLDGQFAAPATDAEFVRRVYLDLIGRVPETGEARAFLDDPSPYKRGRIVDRLLESREHVRRMQQVFDVMWMERRPAKHVTAEQREQFLLQAFAENLPYDKLVRAILQADGADPASRPAAAFLLDRDADPILLTRDVGRMFLGRDMQCAQCHDHPIINDYKQQHFYGLFAFLSRSSVYSAGGLPAALAESADGDVSFTSVFKKKITHKTGPRLLDAPEIPEPAANPAVPYWIGPGQPARSLPVHSRRALLAPELTSGKLPDFDRNIVNRLWALMMGRGLVDPVDMHHSDNPPSHPELLDLLTREFAARGRDIKGFLRELALTRVYQRSSEPPPGSSADLAAPEKFAVAALKPLAPEQLAMSVLEALGLTEPTRRDVEQHLFGRDPKLSALLRLDPKRQALREALFEQTVHDRLKGNIAPFVERYGNPAGQSQDKSDSNVHQALFVTNGSPVQSWIGPNGSNLTSRLIALPDEAIAEELMVAVLSRRPTLEERQEILKTLKESPKDQRAATVQDLVWAILSSVEFRFNH